MIIDASVWVSYFLSADLNYNASRVWLQHQLAIKTPLIGPTFLLSEVGGPIARRTGQTLARNALNELHAFPSLILMNIDEGMAEVAANLAIDLQLRGCDAVYVALAEQLDLSLITWDREIINRSTPLIRAQTP